MVTTEKLTVSVNEAAKILGISRNLAFAACKNGSLPTLKIGKRILVPKSKLMTLINGEKSPEATN